MSKLKITIEWNPDLRSYGCKIDGFGNIAFQGHNGDDLAMNIDQHIKRWAAFEDNESTRDENELAHRE